jgi:predicted ABC-type ATPase
MRVFAGPNGSGKSTVINKVRKQKSKGRYIDFGFYINADDIAQGLRNKSFDFKKFEISCSKKEFKRVVMASGLINAEFSEDVFDKSFTLRANKIYLKDHKKVENLAQMIADFLRKKLLELRKKFSFETVFSHRSKVDIMIEAARLGYKVYLYFVSTSSPEINKFRVEARVKKGGHFVQPDKIVERYGRSMDLLFEAAQNAYQVFFFDNSNEGEEASLMFAHFKKNGDEKKWDPVNENDVPNWFIRYYSNKIDWKIA